MLGIIWALSVCIAPIHPTAFDPPARKGSGITELLSVVAAQRAEIEALRNEVHGLWIELQDHIADVESDGDDLQSDEKRLIRRAPRKSGLICSSPRD